MPDAFTNPEYGQFAIKGALAATLCYLIFTGAEYPGIYTSVITCMVCSLSTIGASTQKGVLRFAGSAIGGLMGVFTILYVFPHLDSLGGFWLPFGAGTAVAAYVNFGSPRLSYCGYQIGLAFYKAVLQGYGPATELKVVKDRLIGIALGLLVFGLIDTQLWPVRAAARVRPSFANALRSMADLARLPSQDEDPAMVLSRAYALRLKIYQGFATVQQLVAETMFEPGAAEREVMLQLLAEAQAAFLVLLALVQDRADAALQGGTGDGHGRPPTAAMRPSRRVSRPSRPASRASRGDPGPTWLERWLSWSGARRRGSMTAPPLQQPPMNAAGWPSIANSCPWSRGWGPITRRWFSHESVGGLG